MPSSSKLEPLQEIIASLRRVTYQRRNSERNLVLDVLNTQLKAEIAIGILMTLDDVGCVN